MEPGDTHPQSSTPAAPAPTAAAASPGIEPRDSDTQRDAVDIPGPVPAEGSTDHDSSIAVLPESTHPAPASPTSSATSPAPPPHPLSAFLSPPSPALAASAVSMAMYPPSPAARSTPSPHTPPGSPPPSTSPRPTTGPPPPGSGVPLDVECGLNKGTLYLDQLEAGSKGPCVMYDSAWLTPNEFQYVSGRETAKDWKRSIKHFGKSLKLLVAKGFMTLQPPKCYCEVCNNGQPPPPEVQAAAQPFTTAMIKEVKPVLSPEGVLCPPPKLSPVALKSDFDMTPIKRNRSGKQRSPGGDEEEAPPSESHEDELAVSRYSEDEISDIKGDDINSEAISPTKEARLSSIIAELKTYKKHLIQSIELKKEQLADPLPVVSKVPVESRLPPTTLPIGEPPKKRKHRRTRPLPNRDAPLGDKSNNNNNNSNTNSNNNSNINHYPSSSNSPVLAPVAPYFFSQSIFGLPPAAVVAPVLSPTTADGATAVDLMKLLHASHKTVRGHTVIAQENDTRRPSKRHRNRHRRSARPSDQNSDSEHGVSGGFGFGGTGVPSSIWCPPPSESVLKSILTAPTSHSQSLHASIVTSSTKGPCDLMTSSPGDYKVDDVGALDLSFKRKSINTSEETPHKKRHFDSEDDCDQKEFVLDLSKPSKRLTS